MHSSTTHRIAGSDQCCSLSLWTPACLRFLADPDYLTGRTVPEEMELPFRKGFFDASTCLWDSCFLCVAMTFPVATLSPGPARAQPIEAPWYCKEMLRLPACLLVCLTWSSGPALASRAASQAASLLRLVCGICFLEGDWKTFITTGLKPALVLWFCVSHFVLVSFFLCVSPPFN